MHERTAPRKASTIKKVTLLRDFFCSSVILSFRSDVAGTFSFAVQRKLNAYLE